MSKVLSKSQQQTADAAAKAKAAAADAEERRQQDEARRRQDEEAAAAIEAEARRVALEAEEAARAAALEAEWTRLQEEEERERALEMATGPGSRRTVSVAAFQQYVIAEAHRQRAVLVREEEAANQRLIAASHAAYVHKISDARDHRALAASALAHHRGALALRGAAGREECETNRLKTLIQKQVSVACAQL